MKRNSRSGRLRGGRPAARPSAVVLGAGALAVTLLSLAPGASPPASAVLTARTSSAPATPATASPATVGPATVGPMTERPATSGPPTSSGQPPSVLCAPSQYLNVDGPWGSYVLKNNDFYPTTAPECITHYKSGPNFGVTMSGATAQGAESDAYPNIFVGCSWGRCSDHSVLPARLTALPHPWVSWYARFQPYGKWNANLDIWLSWTPRRTGQVTGAEVMIWMAARGFGPVRAAAHIDGIGWRLVHWTTRSLADPKITWPLIIFRAAQPRAHVRRLALQPFFHVLERLHLINRREWIDSVHGGFEIWNGGQGMRMNWFRVGGGLQRRP